MGVVQRGGSNGYSEVFAPLLAADCFYCHEPLGPQGVMWSGTSGEIILHPGCVIELTIRLLRDVHEIECQRKAEMVRGR